MHTSDEGVYPQSIDIVVVSLLCCREQLSHEVEIRVDLSSCVEKTLRHDDGRVVTVVQSESLKYPGHGLRVLLHVVPQPGRVLGPVAIAKLD